MLKFKFEIELDEERLRDLFESNEIKFSKAKVKRIKENLEEYESDYIEILEQAFEEILDNIIQEEFEK